MPERIANRIDTKDYCFASLQNLLIAIWIRDTTLAGLEVHEQLSEKLAQQYPGGGGLLTIVPAEASLPSGEVREAIAKGLRKFSGFTRVAALAFEGSGFRAAAVRGIVTGITLLSRHTFPSKVFGSLEEASAWLAPQLPSPRLTGQEIVEAVGQLRASLIQ